ncbi:MAG: hypothetical protein PHQ42_03340 [Patescibacteria group bacterium]|nr:hypothetical protein [Patescibacteria group bacterium]
MRGELRHSYYAFLFSELMKATNIFYAANFLFFFSIFNSSPEKEKELIKILARGNTGKKAGRTALNLIKLGSKLKIKIFSFVFEGAVPAEIVKVREYYYLKIRISREVSIFCRIDGGCCPFLEIMP